MGVLSAAAAIRKLPHAILTLISLRFETGGRRCSVRPHTVGRPRLARGDGAATRVGFLQFKGALCAEVIRLSSFQYSKRRNCESNLAQVPERGLTRRNHDVRP